MPTNDFKTVADGGGANVLSQSDYLALATYLSNGWSSGIVPSNQLNKTLRQTSVMSYVLAQFILNQSGNDVLDNGTPATIIDNLVRAVQLVSQGAFDAYTDSGTGNAYVITTVPATTAYRNNQLFAVRATHGNTGAATFNAGAGVIPLVRRDGAALQNADIASAQVFLVAYESSGNKAVIMQGLPSEYLDSPPLRGTPTAPTAAPLDNSTKVSTTAYADAAVAAAVTNVSAQYANSNFTAGSFGDYWTDTSAGGFTITLPDPPLGKNLVTFRDIFGTWSPNNLTINPGTKTILGATGSLVANVAGRTFGMWYDTANTTWKLI